MTSDTVEFLNDTPAEEQPRRGGVLTDRRWVIVGLVLLAVLLSTAVWFLALSPKATTISVQRPQDIQLGQEFVVAGKVDPSGAARTVTVSHATAAGGPWIAGPSAKTDNNGDFAIALESKAAGETWVRATVLQDGRMQEQTSAPQSAHVRQRSTVTLKASVPTVPTTGKVTLSGASTPVGGSVSIEQSSDGLEWALVEVKVTSNQEGGYRAQLKNLRAGTWQFRAKVAESDTASESVSKSATVRVEDYKAAGDKYLALIKPYNKALTAMNDAVDAYNVSNSESARRRLKTADAALSTASSKAAKDIRAFKGWPERIAGTVEALAASMVIEADALNQMSKANSIDDRNELWTGFSDAQASGTPNAIEIRDVLGLPKRSG
jgi:hypothetical protein